MAKAAQMAAQPDIERAVGDRILHEAAADAVYNNTAIVGAMGKTGTLVNRLMIFAVPVVVIFLVVFGIAMAFVGSRTFKQFKGWNDEQTRKREAGADNVDEDS